jgi:hypothetical protein
VVCLLRRKMRGALRSRKDYRNVRRNFFGGKLKYRTDKLWWPTNVLATE